MIDGYIIMNRKTNLIIKMFVLNISIIIILVIWGVNTFYYQSYFHIHSKLINFNSYYLLEVLIPEEEVNQITEGNVLLIGDKVYNYSVYNISDSITYQDNVNYIKLYLDVYCLDEKYRINNYRLDIKIPKENKKIINYFIE